MRVNSNILTNSEKSYILNNINLINHNLSNLLQKNKMNYLVNQIKSNMNSEDEDGEFEEYIEIVNQFYTKLEKPKIIQDTGDWQLLITHEPMKLGWYNKITNEIYPTDKVKNYTKDWIEFPNEQFLNTITGEINDIQPDNTKLILKSKNSINQRENTLYISKDCLKNYKIKDILGSGAFGTVVVSCLKNDCHYVMKIQKIEDNKSLKRIEKESEIAEKMSEIEVGPQFYGSWYCEDDGIYIIITEKWDDSLNLNEIKTNWKFIYDKLEILINKMHKNGYIHSDIFPKNILVKKDENGNIKDLVLTDFGSAYNINDKQKPSNIKKFFDYHYEFFPIFFEDNDIKLKDVKNDPKLLDQAFLYHLKYIFSTH